MSTRPAAAQFARNRERDRRLEKAAAEDGWQSLVVWECELKDIEGLLAKLIDFLGPARLGNQLNHDYEVVGNEFGARIHQRS